MAGLAKLSLVMRHEAWTASGGRGLTPTQSQILAVIAGSPGVGIKALSRQLAITMATASEAVSALVEKGLVQKSASPDDGRAIVLSLTVKGRREASMAAQWPASMLSAIESLPPAEQASLLRGLVGMVRALQEQGAVPTARMCVGCTYFRPNQHPGSDKVHHCQFIDAPIADADLRLDCREMTPADEALRVRLWNHFVNGRRLDDETAGVRPAAPASGTGPFPSTQTTSGGST